MSASSERAARSLPAPPFIGSSARGPARLTLFPSVLIGSGFSAPAWSGGGKGEKLRASARSARAFSQLPERLVIGARRSTRRSIALSRPLLRARGRRGARRLAVSRLSRWPARAARGWGGTEQGGPSPLLPTTVAARPPDPASWPRPGPLDLVGPRFPFPAGSALPPSPPGAPLCLPLRARPPTCRSPAARRPPLKPEKDLTGEVRATTGAWPGWGAEPEVSTEDRGRELAGAGRGSPSRRAVRWSCLRCVFGYTVFDWAGAPSGLAMPRLHNVPVSFTPVTCHENVGNLCAVQSGLQQSTICLFKLCFLRKVTELLSYHVWGLIHAYMVNWSLLAPEKIIPEQKGKLQEEK